MRSRSHTKSLPVVLSLALLLGACNAPNGRPVPNAEPQATMGAPAPPISGAPTVEPTLATLQLAVYPPAARTGIDELDAVIDAVLAHDVEALRNLTGFVQAACTTAEATGAAPSCQAREAQGSLVDAVPFLGAESRLMSKGDFMLWAGPDVRGLLAAYRVSAPSDAGELFPSGEYAIVFLQADGSSPLILQVRQGKIVRFDEPSVESLTEALALQASDAILPLVDHPIPTTVPWSRFDDPGGRFAFVFPPTWTLLPGPDDEAWRLADQIEVAVGQPGDHWVRCFDQALGDCPMVEDDRQVEINGSPARRIQGYFGAVGGGTPQAFVIYVFALHDGSQLTFTAYALPFGTQVQGANRVWPLEGMVLELFERTVSTVTISS